MTFARFLKLFKNFAVAAAIIMIWRGIWYILDLADVFIFGGTHFWTAVFGIVVGIIILYVPDHNLDELGKL